MLQYKRINLESGAVYIGDFNASHHWCFADSKGEPHSLIERVIIELINKWNRQQPLAWMYSTA